MYYNFDREKIKETLIDIKNYDIDKKEDSNEILSIAKKWFNIDLGIKNERL